MRLWAAEAAATLGAEVATSAAEAAGPVESRRTQTYLTGKPRRAVAQPLRTLLIQIGEEQVKVVYQLLNPVRTARYS